MNNDCCQKRRNIDVFAREEATNIRKLKCNDFEHSEQNKTKRLIGTKLQTGQPTTNNPQAKPRGMRQSIESKIVPTTFAYIFDDQFRAKLGTVRSTTHQSFENFA